MSDSDGERGPGDVAGELRPLVEEHVYAANKLKELGWSRNATRVRPLKGWFGLAHKSGVFTGKVDVEGTRRVLAQLQTMQTSSSESTD